MKKIIISIGFLLLAGLLHAQSTEKVSPAVAEAQKTRIVEAACGECKFGMEGTGCALAVRIDGKPYPVVGTPNIDAFGDAHGEAGMCNVIRKAEVAGEIKDGKFAATTFRLLPVKKEN